MDANKIGIVMVAIALIILGISMYKQETGEWPGQVPTPPPTPTPSPTPTIPPKTPTPTPTPPPNEGEVIHISTEFSASRGERI